ncbi:MAG: hypothetical protein ACYTAF_04185 [Planctomycetota bacterium]
MRWIVMASLAMTALGPAQDGDRLWLVFGPDSPVPMDALKKWPRPDRLVLAIEDYRTGRLPASLLGTVRDLKKWMGADFGLPVADREALQTLKRLDIRRLPALILFRRGRVHVVEGIPRSPEEVLRCVR